MIESYICVLFDGKFIVKEFRMGQILPTIRIPKPIDILLRPDTYYSEPTKIECLIFEYVGKLPDGRCLYTLDE